MGLIICNKHGEQGFFEVCEHIYSNFNKGVYPEMKELSLLRVKVCDDCYDRNEINKLPQISLYDTLADPEAVSDKEVELAYTKYKQIKRFSFCRICAMEIQLQWARQQGKEDPFEAFENTITFREKNVADKLKKRLLEKYEFQKSIINPDTEALFIYPGHIGEPLLIKVYYVTDLNEQNVLTKYIEDFFQEQNRNQRKILFYESESWIKGETTEGYETHHRGKEKILKEVFIK